MIGYAVIETAFEYDDQRYFENGSLPPTRIYKSEKRAKDEVILATYDFFENNSLEYFGSDPEDIITEEGIEHLKSVLPILEVYAEKTLNLEDVTDVALAMSVAFKNQSDMREKIYSYLNIKPYSVVQVTVIEEDESPSTESPQEG